MHTSNRLLDQSFVEIALLELAHVDHRASIRSVQRATQKRQREREIFNFSIKNEHGFCFVCCFFFLYRRRRSLRCCPLDRFVLSSICSSLNVPTINNIIQCISTDGQIGFVYNTDVEPLHIVSISKPLTSPSPSSSSTSTMSNFFHRKTGQ